MIGEVKHDETVLALDWSLADWTNIVAKYNSSMRTIAPTSTLRNITQCRDRYFDYLDMLVCKEPNASAESLSNVVSNSSPWSEEEVVHRDIYFLFFTH